MAVADIHKVRILSHAGFKMEVLASLQEEGLIHIDSLDIEEMGLSRSAVDVSDLDHNLHRLNSALNYLADFEERKFTERLFAQKPQLEKEKRDEALEWDYLPTIASIERIQSEKSDILSHIKFLEKEEEFLSPLSDLKVPIKSVKPTHMTEVLIGSLPASRMEDLENLARGEALHYSIIKKSKRLVQILLIYLKADKNELEASLKEFGFSPLFFTDPVLSKGDETDTVKDVLDKISKEKTRKEKDLVSLDNEGRSLTVHRDKLMRVHDVLMNEREKRQSLRFLGETDKAFCLDGWILAKDEEKLLAKLQPYSDYVECYFRRPLPEEDPPVALQNPKAGKPFELITKLYGLPKSGTMDPTPYLMPFFFIFVGLTVSEAGYGLLVTLLSLLGLKLVKPKGGFRLFLILLAILGVSNVIIGTLVGGWFGFPIRRLMILDPLQNPVSFLLLSLALGFIQVWFGTFLDMISRFKNRDYLQALFVQGGWLVLLPALVLYGVSKNSWAGIVALAGACGIVFFAAPSRNPLARFFGGLYSLYDISRYLADILSYSRLLALGLATSVIAMVVNTLCQTALGIPWIGWLFAALIFVGGHLFNLGISFLGGFVHSMRLQFVEFFSKFFQSGGKPFKPLELEGKYVEFI
ncbi:MAG: V-type ATP synthase subunit I [Candidatus Aminicenantes bacterium]|nr:V-type ATP synthase subunit I [Candidatus Aminicenantes bacterium]